MSAMNLSDRRGRNVFYNSRAWRSLRDWYLRQNPLCVECQRRGFLVPAVHLNHVVPLALAPERALDPTNIEGLCKSCHAGKTREEQTGRKSRHWSDGRVGLDGLPLSPTHPWNRERGDG
jgi:5-methylcytosine-specific restriction protein A